MQKKNVVVFDFDGTLTTKDTLLEFIKYACGKKSFYWGFLIYAPILVMMKLHLYPNGKAKQKVFAHFFKGKRYDWFIEKGKRFASIIEQFERNDVINKLVNHIHHGDTVYVVTASIEEWVRPWCEQFNISNVIGTKMEVAGGIITGKFCMNNCYGQEKVNRLLQVEPDRDSYYLYAYGDSDGDKEMIDFADHGIQL